VSIETMDQSLKTRNKHKNFQKRIETIRFYHKDEYECEIFSLVNSARAQDWRGRTTANLV